MADEIPLVWILDSERGPLAEAADAFSGWAEAVYTAHGSGSPDWSQPPDAIVFSAGIPGGPAGAAFRELAEQAGNIPLLAAARVRSLSQAVAFFRAGAADYLSLPLEPEETRERIAEALDRAARRALEGLVVEYDPADGEAGPENIALTLRPAAAPAGPEEDILAALAGGGEPAPEAAPAAAAQPEEEDEPIPVDGLPIPSLWEELPCGLLIFDSSGNLVFCNILGLELFGYSSQIQLEDDLEHRRAVFEAHAFNQKPLPDNQWPQVLALKHRAARSAVISVRKPDRRRVWLKIDCLPHVAEGKINRLSMTVVNLTGELPPLARPAPPAAAASAVRQKKKASSRKRK